MQRRRLADHSNARIFSNKPLIFSRSRILREAARKRARAFAKAQELQKAKTVQAKKIKS